MKAVLTFLTFWTILVGSLHANKEPLHSWVPCEKTYIDPKQIHFANSDIFIGFDDLWLQTAAIFVDEYGFYFNSMRAEDQKLVWICPNKNCRRPNEDYRQYCRICGCSRYANTPK